tara:strand:- start:268 stop:585 length:318 start_codon:yes stop_codon:yes gene_type:complete
MKLITKEIEKEIEKKPLYFYEENDIDTKDAKIIVKFFGGGQWTWWAIEGEKLEDGDIRFFGLVQGFEKEFGYFTLRELEGLKFPPFGLGVERDKYFSNKTIKDVI